MLYVDCSIHVQNQLYHHKINGKIVGLQFAYTKARVSKIRKYDKYKKNLNSRTINYVLRIVRDRLFYKKFRTKFSLKREITNNILISVTVIL